MDEKRVYPPMTPGRFLELEFLEPLDMTAYALAKAIGVDPPRVYEIVRGKRGISADSALRLARYFGTSPQFWLNLQAHYDLEVEEERVGASIERAVRPFDPTEMQNMMDRVQIDLRSVDVSSALADAQQSLNAMERLKSEA